MFGTTFLTVLVSILSWGCLAIIARHYGIELPLFHNALIMIVWLAAPPIQLVATIYSLSKVRYWRKMNELRARPQLGLGTRLARGEAIVQQTRHHRSGLERMLGWLIWLGIFSLPYWFDLPSPEFWAGSALLITMAIRTAVPH